jgi:alkylation response protein AidB-like acyl-CoA dehydrogenase
MIDAVLSEEQKMFRESIKKFLKREVIPFEEKSPAQHGEYPLEHIKLYSKLKLMGINIPEEYGGLGGGTYELFILLEEMARAGVFVPHPGHFGATRYIVLFGSEKQKKKYLPSIAAGDVIVSYAQTEPDAGSDSKVMKTTAVLDGNEYVINGRKCFITGSPVAGLFILLAKTENADAGKEPEIRLFIVEKKSSGLSLGKIEKKMGSHSLPMTDVIFENCRIPKENLLAMQGRAFKELMKQFNVQRCANGAICLGKAEFAFDTALAYSKERETFGKPLCQHQGIQWMLADMAMKIKKTRLLLYDVAYKDTNGMNITADASMAKISANEDMCAVIDTAMQILGGYGYMEDYKLETAYRDTRGNSFGGGTPQLLRNRIAIELLKGRY